MGVHKAQEAWDGLNGSVPDLYLGSMVHRFAAAKLKMSKECYGESDTWRVKAMRKPAGAKRALLCDASCQLAKVQAVHAPLTPIKVMMWQPSYFPDLCPSPLSYRPFSLVQCSQNGLSYRKFLQGTKQNHDKPASQARELSMTIEKVPVPEQNVQAKGLLSAALESAKHKHKASTRLVRSHSITGVLQHVELARPPVPLPDKLILGMAIHQPASRHPEAFSVAAPTSPQPALAPQQAPRRPRGTCWARLVCKVVDTAVGGLVSVVLGEGVKGRR